MESLGRTDDILAVIGIIMLLGVLVQSYGSFWQGVYARAAYKNECNVAGSPPTPAQVEQAKKTKRWIIIGIIITLLVIGAIIYIMRKDIKRAAQKVG